jgi:hypothetical protein
MEMVEVYRGPDDESLLLIKGWLESQGMNCVVSSDLVHSVHPLTVDGLGEVRIFVSESDAERARQLIEDFQKRGTSESD